MTMLSFYYFAPELWLLGGAIIALMVGAFGGQKAFNHATLICGLALALAIYWLINTPSDTFRAFEDMLRMDGFIRYSKMLIIGAAFLALIFSLNWLKGEALRKFEYPVLLVLATFGMCILVSAEDFLTLYMGVELSSLALYVMAGFDRDNARSSEAALKYFVLGALASGLLLFGISLIYGFAGSTHFTVLGKLFAHDVFAVSGGLAVGLVFIMIGFCFKMSLVPFHMWTPDVYDGAPASVVAFFAVAPKVAAIVIFSRLLLQPFAELMLYWQDIVLLVAVLSMLLGAFAGLRQTQMKRLLAYSSIGHMGYIMLGVLAGGPDGTQVILIYLTLYLFMSVGTFGFLVGLARRGVAVDALSDLAGLAQSRPRAALYLAVMMFSMAGIPPLAGFFGKFYIFMAALEAGYVWPVIIGVLASVVAAYYYLKIVKIMYFDEPSDVLEGDFTLSSRVALALCLLVTAFYFVAPTALLDMTAQAASLFAIAESAS